MNGLAIGVMLYGFCGGFFGRDSYQDKRVEAFGYDWIVARDEEGNIHFCHFDERWLPSRDKEIAEWMQKPSEDDQ